VSEVVVRDTTASDLMVYAWPFRISDQIEVVCDENDVAVIAVGWEVAEQLGPGRHTFTPLNPQLPVNAFFVRTSAVAVMFDLTTTCVLASTRQTVRLRAMGSVMVRVQDASLLVHQFVGLPFDDVNGGLLRSVQQSVERQLARVLVRRCMIHGAPAAATDPTMLPSIIDEVVTRNPTGAAVSGIEFVRFNQLSVTLDEAMSWEHQSSPSWDPTALGWDGQSQASGEWGMQSGSGSGGGMTSPMPAQASPTTIPPPSAEPAFLTVGTRVLVYWSDGLWHSAAIVQVTPQGQYEIELGDRGERAWVEWNQVVPE
jgi:hypothetical protein